MAKFASYLTRINKSEVELEKEQKIEQTSQAFEEARADLLAERSEIKKLKQKLERQYQASEFKLWDCLETSAEINHREKVNIYEGVKLTHALFLGNHREELKALFPSEVKAVEIIETLK